MKKISKIIIKTQDMNNEKNFESSVLEYFEKEDKKYYNFDTKLGRCELIYQKDILFFSRSGDYAMKFFLELDKENEFSYETEYFHSKFYVLGKKLVFHDDTKQLEFKYMLFDEEKNIVNEIETIIKLMDIRG